MFQCACLQGASVPIVLGIALPQFLCLFPSLAPPSLPCSQVLGRRIFYFDTFGVLYPISHNKLSCVVIPNGLRLGKPSCHGYAGAGSGGSPRAAGTPAGPKHLVPGGDVLHRKGEGPRGGGQGTRQSVRFGLAPSTVDLRPLARAFAVGVRSFSCPCELSLMTRDSISLVPRASHLSSHSRAMSCPMELRMLVPAWHFSSSS